MSSSWTIVEIGSLCDEIFDGPHATPTKTNSGPVFLGISNLKNGKLDLTQTEHLSEADFVRWTRRVTPRSNDVVFSYETRLGEAALIPTGIRCCLGRRMALMRPNPRKVHPRFLLYAFLGPQFQDTIRQRTVHGSTVDRIPLIEFDKFPIRIPEITQQRAISEILGALDDKIELNRRMNETLEAITRAIFKSWFVDFDPVHAKSQGRQPFGMSAETAAVFPDSFGESSFGAIPKVWKVSTLAELFPKSPNCVLTGPFGSHLHASDYRDAGVPLILVKHVANGRILDSDLPFVGEHKAPELERYRLQQGDIVFTRVGAVGRTAFVHEGQKGWLISGQLLRVRIPSDSVLNSRFLSQTYLDPLFTGMVEGHALGTTRPSLNTTLLLNFKFLCPPLVLQRTFAQMVSLPDEQTQANLRETKTLISIRDTLLPKLISGEIRIKDAEKVVEQRV